MAERALESLFIETHNEKKLQKITETLWQIFFHWRAVDPCGLKKGGMREKTGAHNFTLEKTED